jgi:hypothetical protein
MERLTDRIYKIAIDELPKQSMGLEPIGLEVCWGTWDVATPNGPGRGETLAMLFAFRPMGPRGEVLLGTTPPITNAHTLSGLWPIEAEIRSGVAATCNAVRAYIQAQRGTQNGKGTPQGPVMPLRPPIGDGR